MSQYYVPLVDPSQIPTDEQAILELVLLAKQGHERARKKVWLTLHQHASKLAWRLAQYVRFEHEDLVGNGIVYADNAIRVFDPELGTPFLAYANTWLKKGFLEYTNQDCDPDQLKLSINTLFLEILCEPIGSAPENENLTPLWAELDRLLDRAVEHLKPLHQKVVRLRLKNWKFQEIGDFLGTTRQNCSRWFNKARESVWERLCELSGKDIPREIFGLKPLPEPQRTGINGPRLLMQTLKRFILQRTEPQKTAETTENEASDQKTIQDASVNVAKVGEVVKNWLILQRTEPQQPTKTPSNETTAQQPPQDASVNAAKAGETVKSCDTHPRNVGENHADPKQGPYNQGISVSERHHSTKFRLHNPGTGGPTMHRIKALANRILTSRRCGYLYLAFFAVILVVIGHIEPAMAQDCDAGVLTRMGTMLSGAFSGFGQNQAAQAVCSGAQTSIATLTGVSTLGVVGAGLYSWRQNDYSFLAGGLVIVAFIWLVLFLATTLFLGTGGAGVAPAGGI